jgi:hypothetical protein
MTRTPLTLTIVVLAVVLAGCEPESNKIELKYDSDLGKTVLSAHKGDVITWKHDTDPNFKVEFKKGSPCVEKMKTATCTITGKPARALYYCDGCEDPEIVVDTVIGTTGVPPLTALAASPPKALVLVECDESKHVTLDNDPLSVAPGTIVSWAGGGTDLSSVDGWKVDDLSVSMVCKETPPFHAKAGDAIPDNHRCTLQSASSFTYRAYAPKCSAGYVTGTVTITH